MIIERLSVENLREGIYCPRGARRSEEVYDQLEAWIDGDLLRGQIARSDSGEPAGFILYCPVERMPVEVEGGTLYMVQCLFVKPEFQGQEMGRALVETALADAMEQGASGLAAQGHVVQPEGAEDYLPGTFFEHIGMIAGDSRGSASLYYVAKGQPVEPPKYMDPRFSPPQDGARVRIDILDCRLCYTAVTKHDVVKRVAEEAGDSLTVVVHDQNTREAVVDKGMSTGVFIDGKLTFLQGRVSEKDVWNAIHIALAARRLNRDR